MSVFVKDDRTRRRSLARTVPDVRSSLSHLATPHVAILELDLAEGIPAIPGIDAAGTPWTAALVLVRIFTEPIGMLSLAVSPRGVSVEELALAISLELSEKVADRMRACGLLWTGAVPTDGLCPECVPPFVAARDAVLEDGPSITVAICTRNRPEGLARALASIRGQEYRALRVLVVDNAPTDDRNRVVALEQAPHLDMSYVVEPRPGLSRARNRAIQACESEIIAWMDDDEVCDRWWAAELARGFVEHPEAGAVSGMILPAEIETPAQQWFERYGGHSKGRGFTPGVFSRESRPAQSPLYPLPPFGSGGSMAFRLEAIERIGRFDCALGAGTPALAGEDTAAFSALLLAGGTVVWQPTALVSHWHRRDLDSLRNMLHGYGRGLGAFYASVILRHPGTLPELARLLPRALKDLTSPEGPRLGGLGDDFPRSLLRSHRTGLIKGPFSYLRARRLERSTDTPEIPGPARVLLVDVDEIAPVDCRHPAGGLYSSVWVLAMRGGAPLGMVEITVSSPTISVNALRRRLREELGQAWQSAQSAQLRDVSLPSATVVVTTNLNRPEQLRRCVQRLSELDYPDFEVIVVDNRRTGGPGAEVLDELAAIPGVRVLSERRPGISAARNRGVAAARGEIVAFTDDDVEVDPRWLTALGRRFAEEPAVGGVTGLVAPRELETPAQIWFERSGSALDRAYVPASFELAAGGATGASRLSGERFRMIRRALPEGDESSRSLYATGELGIGSNMAFRRTALRSLGGFDEALGVGTHTHGGEDLAAFIGLLFGGGTLAYEPAAIVHHTHRRGVEELEAQLAGYGVGFTAMLAALIRRDPRHLHGLIGMVPSALRLALSRSAAKQAARRGPYPPHLARAELRGMLAGPLAYARSRRAQRRWRP